VSFCSASAPAATRVVPMPRASMASCNSLEVPVPPHSAPATLRSHASPSRSPHSYLSGTACFDRLVSEFGDGIVGADGEVDRRALGPIVFASPDRLEALNSIVWPVIQQMVSDQLLVSAAKVCVVEAAILLQAGWEPMVDEVWLVAVQRKVALDRLMHRNKIDEATARQKIDAQQRAMPLIESYNKSHVLIANDGTVEQVKTVLEKSWGKLIQRCDRTLPELAAAGGSSSLPARWTALCEAHGVAPAAQAAWWRKLRDRHCHRRRHLRTLHRLADMFRHLDGCSAKLAAPLSVTLALFFHTAAFDPAKSVAQNTEDSAALARQFCSECGVGADGDVAATLIEQAPHPGNSTEGDLAHFRDVLNTPLAAESESYMAATLATHLESHHISDAEWRSTRPALLDHLYLSRPRVFVTDHFSPLEKAARRNIAAEVDELRAMCGASFDGSPKDPTHSRSSY
jgi:dephospho-CoA kinase